MDLGRNSGKGMTKGEEEGEGKEWEVKENKEIEKRKGKGMLKLPVTTIFGYVSAGDKNECTTCSRLPRHTLKKAVW